MIYFLKESFAPHLFVYITGRQRHDHDDRGRLHHDKSSARRHPAPSQAQTDQVVGLEAQDHNLNPSSLIFEPLDEILQWINLRSEEWGDDDAHDVVGVLDAADEEEVAVDQVAEAVAALTAGVV